MFRLGSLKNPPKGNIEGFRRMCRAEAIGFRDYGLGGRVGSFKRPPTREGRRIHRISVLGRISSMEPPKNPKALLTVEKMS